MPDGEPLNYEMLEAMYGAASKFGGEPDMMIWNLGSLRKLYREGKYFRNVIRMDLLEILNGDLPDNTAIMIGFDWVKVNP